MTLKIRPYEKKDRDAVTALWAAAFANDPPWNEPGILLEAKLDFQPEGLLVGTAADRLIAVVMAGYEGRRGWINALTVSVDHRGRGYGKAMVNAAISHLDALGAVKVNLQIRGGDGALEGFYKSCGFISEDTLTMGMLTSKGLRIKSGQES